MSAQNTVEFSSGDYKLAFDLSAGKYSLSLPGYDFSSVQPQIKVNDKVCDDLAWNVEDQSADCLKLKGTYGICEASLKISSRNAAAGGLVLDMSATVEADLRSVELVLFAVDGINAGHAIVHGRKMGNCELMLVKEKEDSDFVSSFHFSATEKGKTLQLSNPLMQKNISNVYGTVKSGKLVDVSNTTRFEFPTAGTLTAEALTISVSEDGHSLMEQWVTENTAKEKKFEPAVPGWNTWDYYRWTITEDEVMENAEFIAADPVLSKHIKRIIVDDGWQYCYGEWEPNHLFPSGMDGLASKIQKLGFAPGLWFAPGIIEPHCRIAQWDYDMLAMGENGEPCLGFECVQRFGMLLDPTNEKSQKWLFDLFSRYSKMGYKYFKLDFLWHTYKAKRFKDNSIPRCKLTNRLVSPIREATLGKAEILGCNYHFEGGMDLVDAVRISGDIHPKWKNVLSNVFPIAARYWSQNRLWINDPDFAVCRGRDTSDDPDINRLKPLLVFNQPEDATKNGRDEGLSNLSLDEARILMGLVVMSGGSINLSDKMSKLNEAGLDLARRTVSARSKNAAIPLDLFESVRPSYWLQEIEGGWRAMLVNWGEAEAELKLDLAKRGVNASSGVDFWTDETVDFKNGAICAQLKPHSCLVVEIK